MVNSSKSPEFVPSSFNIYTFSEEIQDKVLVFQVIRMKDSCFVIINDQESVHFSDLSLSLPNRFEIEPLCTSLIGFTGDDLSVFLAKKLGKRLKKAVYVSLNIEGNQSLITAAEKRLFEEISANSNVF